MDAIFPYPGRRGEFMLYDITCMYIIMYMYIYTTHYDIYIYIDMYVCTIYIYMYTYMCIINLHVRAQSYM